MSSRREEKARRRAEREALEHAAASADARRRLITRVGGMVLAVGVVAAVVVAIATGGGSGAGERGASSKGFDKAPVPAPKLADLDQAAAAARCVLLNPKPEGDTHTNDPVTYKSNPPHSGDHDPVPADDGAYRPGRAPGVGNVIHALEHGRVNIQWGRGVTRRQIGQLSSLFDEKSGYHTLLFENQTKMPYQVAATAWGHVLGCKRFTPRVFDALRAFRESYTDKGPEFVP